LLLLKHFNRGSRLAGLVIVDAGFQSRPTTFRFTMEASSIEHQEEFVTPRDYLTP
jgi:hypothetical protein